MELVKDVPAYIREIYTHNPLFISDYFNISIDEIHCGGATISMEIDPEVHFNHRGIIHGGVLEALADSTLGVTGASVGAVVSTLNFSMNFISNVKEACRISASAEIRHHGRTTMVIETEVKGPDGKLLATILTTMFINSRYEEIPAKW